MLPLHSLSPSSEKEALNEVELLATLRHPNIIQYITSYRTEECIVIVTVGFFMLAHPRIRLPETTLRWASQSETATLECLLITTPTPLTRSHTGAGAWWRSRDKD